jgi:hypothetical protein
MPMPFPLPPYPFPPGSLPLPAGGLPFPFPFPFPFPMVPDTDTGPGDKLPPLSMVFPYPPMPFPWPPPDLSNHNGDINYNQIDYNAGIGTGQGVGAPVHPNGGGSPPPLEHGRAFMQQLLSANNMWAQAMPTPLETNHGAHNQGHSQHMTTIHSHPPGAATAMSSSKLMPAPAAYVAATPSIAPSHAPSRTFGIVGRAPKEPTVILVPPSHPLLTAQAERAAGTTTHQPWGAHWPPLPALPAAVPAAPLTNSVASARGAAPGLASGVANAGVGSGLTASSTSVSSSAGGGSVPSSSRLGPVHGAHAREMAEQEDPTGTATRLALGSMAHASLFPGPRRTDEGSLGSGRPALGSEQGSPRLGPISCRDGPGSSRPASGGGHGEGATRSSRRRGPSPVVALVGSGGRSSVGVPTGERLVAPTRTTTTAATATAAAPLSPGRGGDSDVEQEIDDLIHWSNKLSDVESP